MADEDLYAELQRQEEEEDHRFDQRRAMEPMRKAAPPRPDPDKAVDRYNREIAPVLEARRRVAAGLPPTDNPAVNLWLRMTGKHKVPEMAPDEIVEPSKGLVMAGPSVEEIQKEIAANPEKFRHLAKAPAPTRKVDAKRKTSKDLHHD